MRRLALVLALLTSAPAFAQVWSHYDNGRFGYGIDVPPGYVGQGESQNGDGQVFYLPDGLQGVTVWGGMLDSVPLAFETEATDRFVSDVQRGWTVTYQASTPQWATWSGTRANRVLYQRMILLCDEASYAAFRAEYEQRDLSKMHAVIEGLVRSFVPLGC